MNLIIKDSVKKVKTNDFKIENRSGNILPIECKSGSNLKLFIIKYSKLNLNFFT